MSEINSRQGDKSDELDLLVLLASAIAYLRRFSILIGGFMIVGIIAGACLYWFMPKQYASKMILHSFALTNLEHIQIINSWNDYLKKGEPEALAQQINCNSGVMNNLISISADEIQKMFAPTNPHGFIIHVRVKDPSVFDELQKCIVYGLENSEYVKKRLAIKRENLTQLITKAEREVMKLDSLKSEIERIINTGKSSSVVINISGINTEMISLSEKLLAYREELKFANAVQVLQKFNKTNRVERRPITVFLIAGLISGFVIGYFISLIIYLKEKLRKVAR